MSEMLQSVKSDLLSRRLLPLLVLVGVALLAAIGYALSGGSGGTSTPAALTPSVPVGKTSPALAVTVASVNPHEAVSETPGGAKYQSSGPTRNPFAPLPEPSAKSAGAKASSSSSNGQSGASNGGSSSSGGSSSGGSSSSGSSSNGSSGSSGGSAPSTPAPPATKPVAPQPAYKVSVQFGPASTTPGQSANLTSYPNLKTLAPLPSKQDVRIVFERVSTSGTGAIFKLVNPPILHGQAQCLPNSSECETIDLAAGQSEELEYVEADGQTVVYELKVLSIVKAKQGAKAASIAKVKRGAKAAEAKHK